MYCFLIEQLFTFLDKGILEEIFDQTRLLKLEKKVRTGEDISTVQGRRGCLIIQDYYMARACKYNPPCDWSILEAGFSRNAHGHYERC